MWVGLYARQPLPLSQHDQSPLARAPPSMWVGLYARQPVAPQPKNNQSPPRPSASLHVGRALRPTTPAPQPKRPPLVALNDRPPVTHHTIVGMPPRASAPLR